MSKKKRKNKKTKKKIKDSVKKRFRIKGDKVFYWSAKKGKPVEVKSKGLARKIKKLLGVK
jgi:hypothetical protein